MKILRTVEVAFDEVTERQRLMNSFTGTVRDTLIVILQQFVAGDWHAAWDKYLGLKRADRDGMHALVVECLTAFAATNQLDGSTPPRVQARSRYYDAFGFDQRELEPGYPVFGIHGRIITIPVPNDPAAS